MKDNKRHPKQRSRLDRFLFFSKFALLVIVALIFVLAYSFSYRDFPVSTAQYQFSDHENDPNSPAYTPYPLIKTLIIMDYTASYENDAYTGFYPLNTFVSSISNIEYDLILINGRKNNSTILNNMSDDLLLRIHQKKDYDYIMAVGDKAIAPAKEIHDFFYPSSQILLYNVSNTAISDALTPVQSVADSIENAISTVQNMNPDKPTMLFLCNNDDYSGVVTGIALAHIAENKELSYEILYADDYDINDISAYIKERSSGSVVFYVSFLQNQSQGNYYHDEIINKIQNNTSKIIYDLSPITISDDIKYSIRCWPLEDSSNPMGYLALSPPNSHSVNYELVEFAIANIATPERVYEYTEQHYSDSTFVSWCLESVGFDQFPDNISDQIQFCVINSLFITKSDLQPGDLIFLSSKSNSSINDIDGVAIYVNAEIMIGLNSKGIICPTKIKSEEYQIYFAHPYLVFDYTEPSS